MAAIVLAVFVVSIGYGVILPTLPYLIERLLGSGVQAAQVSRHTGLLTAVYTLFLFLFSPLWCRLSDRHGSHGVLMFGLVGFGLTSMIFVFVEGLAAVYAERALSGLFAAAVTPVAAAAIGKLTTTEQGRARRLTFVSMAGIAGFLIGPMLGVSITRLSEYLFASILPAGAIAAPLAVTAMLAFVAAFLVSLFVPRERSQYRPPQSVEHGDTAKWLVPTLLAISFIVSTGVGVFEVGLALRGKEQLSLTHTQIAVMFTECSIVMFLVQSIVFSPWFKPARTRWLITPALAVLAVGLFLVPHASDFSLMLVVIGAVAASAGVLSPVVTYWISAKAGSAQGWQLGKQTAASSLGATIGSAAGGLLFSPAALPGASFILATLMALLGFVVSLKLPRLLVRQEIGDDTAYTR
jgi:MFS family permease